MPSPGLSKSSEPATAHGSPRLSKRRRETNDEGNAVRTRRKTACQPCRLRKTKCEGNRPICSVCATNSRECEYTDLLPEKLTLESATDLLCSKIDDLHGELKRLANPPSRSVEQDHESLIALQDLALERQFSNPDRPSQVTTYITESSKDFLQIPAHRTTSDAVLTWPIFDGRFSPMSLVGMFFASQENDQVFNSRRGSEHFAIKGGIYPPNEEHLPLLVDNFLQNVHTKNPILDVEELVKQTREIASEGLRWDPATCLVLLAAALGSIAKPFDADVVSSPAQNGTSPTFIADQPATQEDLRRGESYFILACRRLGCLKHSLLGAHCYFFAGVYLMYTMRPLESWQYFNQSSVLYQLYMKTRHGVAFHEIDHNIAVAGQIEPSCNVKQRRMEESLYWSCFKSECEFRVELPLPQSEIATYHHCQMFPSPPSPATERSRNDSSMTDHISPRSGTVTLRTTSDVSTSSTASAERLEVRQHAKRLCNEEESWYYYLTEIALRRIGNRIINTFFSRDCTAWIDIRPLLRIALEFETQVSAWSANLPAAMQHWETTYTIRAPPLDYVSGGRGNHVSRELSWAIDNRLLEMRSWLYQPFLYYLIHSQDDGLLNRQSLAANNLSPEDAAALSQFIGSGIECNLKILDVRSLRHRHHGLWYDMRSIMCASLILLAVVKSGHEEWIPGGAETLWGPGTVDGVQHEGIGGKIGHVLEEFDFWAIESPDLRRHRTVLEDVTLMVREMRLARKNL